MESEKTESPLAVAVASRLCPHASWKMTPPQPLAMMTGKRPEGHSFAERRAMATSRAFLATAILLTFSRKKDQPPWVPGEWEAV